jgi:hypothetical protein
MSAASASIVTTERRSIGPEKMPGLCRAFCFRKYSRPPAGEQPEAASWTPFALARCENGARGMKLTRLTRTAEAR